MRGRREARWCVVGVTWLVLASLAPAGPMCQEPAGRAGPMARIMAWRLPQPAAVGQAEGPAPAASRKAVLAATSILRQLRGMLADPPPGAAPPGATLERLALWSERLADAQLELADRREARVAILGEALGRAADLEALARELVGAEASGWSALDLDVATFARVKVEARLLREERPPAR